MNAQLKRDLARIEAAKADVNTFLAQHMDEAAVAQAWRLIGHLTELAHADGAEFGAARERVAQQLGDSQS